INAPGMRSKSYYLVTTLTDSTRYGAAELADLYRQRWDVELFFRDIKTTMGMDVLRCRTPALVRKEVLMHFIAYNAVRRLIVDAANAVENPPRRISFKASIQALRQWEPQLHRGATDASERRRLLDLLREAIGARQVTARPGRREPRCLKRRPKPFALLTAPRHQMFELPHRGRYRASVA
ncbi:transposase, partial [Rhodocyclaceae bacterium SMB388]